MTTPITTARLNNIDPLAWLGAMLARVTDPRQNRLVELLPWQWKHLE